jgi:superoxide dismutase, Cu-Zn family
MTNPFGAVLVSVLAVSAFAGCEQSVDDGATTQQSEARRVNIRTATLRTAAGATVARVLFTSFGSARALATITINEPGLRAGFHGMHIHANNDPANGDGCIADPAQPATTHFVSADGHWNPTAATHGAHAGDMPSPLVLADGTALLSFSNDIDLAASDLAGRAVILHDGLDNFGNIPVVTDPAAPGFANAYTPNSPAATTLTANTGNAGTRHACGLIQ